MACPDCPLTKKQPKGDLQRLLEFSTMSYGCTTHLRNRYLDTREYNRNNYPSARGVTCAESTGSLKLFFNLVAQSVGIFSLYRFIARLLSARCASRGLWRGYGPGLLQGREEDASCMEYGDRPSSQPFCIVSSICQVIQ